MPKMDSITFFKQSLKSDAYHADEIINIFLLRPLAAFIVWLVYPTKITPNHLTVAAIVIGTGAAIAYVQNSPIGVIMGGFLILLKDILDDADGQLARSKQLYSRKGRFLDSIGDFFVNVFVFTAITISVYRIHTSLFTIVLGFASFFTLTLRVSYHVFYQVSYLHQEKRYQLNRISEEITEDDKKGERLTYLLQRIFILIYGWQDKFMINIDRWCMGKNYEKIDKNEWYGNRTGLRLSGLMGFGTEYTILAVCSWSNSLYVYLIINVFLLNAILLVSILYRKLNLQRKIRTNL